MQGPKLEAADFSNVELVTLTVVAGISIATVYYIQPIIYELQAEFALSKAQSGLLAAAFQFGLASGLLAMLPLADTMGARKVLLFAVPGQIISLLCVSASPTFALLLASAVLVGFFGITPYILPPYASLRSSPARLGLVTGALTGGVSLGILIARVASGFIAGWMGWRAVFFIAALTMCFALIPLYSIMAPQKNVTTMAYKELLTSMFKIARALPALRVASAIQGFSFSSFGIFWLGSAFHFRQHFGWTSESIGSVGLLGVVAIVASPFIGPIAQMVGLERFRLISTAGSLAAWTVLALFRDNLLILAIATIVLTLCAVGADISCRMRLYTLAVGLRTRMNAIYTITMLAFSAVSSALVGVAWSAAAWSGICGLGALAALAAAVLSATNQKVRDDTSVETATT